MIDKSASVLANALVGEGVRYPYSCWELLYMNRFGSLAERGARKSWLTADDTNLPRCNI